MNSQRFISQFWLPLLGLTLFLTAILCRPLIPIDETRYMSVAWEMSLHQNWFDPLTKNFEPYSHKPPLLFWLINMFWSVFGISRWAGTIPVVISSVLCIYLTGLLGKALSKHDDASPLRHTQRIWMVMAASFPFMIYGTLIMFDFMICVFVLLSLIFVLRYAEKRRIIDLVMLAVCLGFGVLVKGPVAYLYVLPVYLLAPFWKKDLTDLKKWYAACLGAILISSIPVLFWLVPVLQASDNQFAFWLLWNQTAGRVTGNFTAAHIRPIYFYLPLLPAFMMPWVLFPQFWRSLSRLKSKIPTDTALRFLLCWFVPVFVAFSLISGKQPHYLVPLVPAIVLLLILAFEKVHTKILARTLAIVVTLFISGQIIAKHYFFAKYDLSPVVSVLEKYPDKPLAYVSNYNAEFSFLAKRTSKVDDMGFRKLKEWFKNNPEGLAVIRFDKIEETKPYHMILHMKYRGHNLGVLSEK